MTVQFAGAVPVFRIFSLDKAREFYLDWDSIALTVTASAA